MYKRVSEKTSVILEFVAIGCYFHWPTIYTLTCRLVYTFSAGGVVFEGPGIGFGFGFGYGFGPDSSSTAAWF